MDKKGLKDKLSPIQFEVMCNEATEPPFQNEYWDNKEPGIYVDRISGKALFASVDKFDSGTGWPSFVRPIQEQSVSTHKDFKLFVPRDEVKSTSSGAHLGHVFDDGPADRGGKRYCINSASLRFIPVHDMEKQGYGEFLTLFKDKK